MNSTALTISTTIQSPFISNPLLSNPLICKPIANKPLQGNQNSHFLLTRKATWQGHSRSHCEQLISAYDLDTIHFARWLALPQLGLLLVFRHQQCVAVERPCITV